MPLGVELKFKVCPSHNGPLLDAVGVGFGFTVTVTVAQADTLPQTPVV
jgi:hypothetical protein